MYLYRYLEDVRTPLTDILFFYAPPLSMLRFYVPASVHPCSSPKGFLLSLH
ncbi:hypothetical protein JCM10003_1395 [Bacteroides pyogenes JCM 10003]|nr:hypothetical protein JCM10003_1395 [Bacteroides pyogenes JCM 10003]